MDNIKDIMKNCLEISGYEVTDSKLNELFEIYQDCQEWDNDIMLTGNTYDEIEDFVEYSPCVNEVFDKKRRHNEVPICRI